MWSSCLLAILRIVFRPLKDVFWASEEKARDKLYVKSRKLEKTPFYSHILPNQIQVYQLYIDQTFELSPTLEFKEDDSRLHMLLAEAVENDCLSELDLELMRLQYVYADEFLRQRHRSRWVETVVNRKDNDFFPDAWAIVAAIFDGSRLGTPIGNEVESEACSIP